MNPLPDLRTTEPELLQDDIEAVLQDSMDIDWTCATGARAVMQMLHALAIAAGTATDREAGMAEGKSAGPKDNAQPSQPLSPTKDNSNG